MRNDAKLSPRPAVLFDLDGTLVDSVYQHVLAWKRALDQVEVNVAVWTIHRKIGMSGGLFARALVRETGRELTAELIERIHVAHREAYKALAADVSPLPGANELLALLRELGVPVAIATSAGRDTADKTMAGLEVPSGTPVITRDLVARAKPDPDLFLAAAAALQVPIEDCLVVGDSVWDLLAAQRARALGIGLLSGGYGSSELERAGAFRVYEDPADMLRRLDEVGVRRAD